MTTTEKTYAQRFADRFDNDGQRFEDDDGVRFEDAADEMGASVEHDRGYRRGTRYVFPDGSVIVTSDAAWDFLHPDCACGFCWECGGSPHERPRCIEEAEEAKKIEANTDWVKARAEALGRGEED